MYHLKKATDMQSSIGRKASYVVVLPSSPEIELILLVPLEF